MTRSNGVARLMQTGLATIPALAAGLALQFATPAVAGMPGDALLSWQPANGGNVVLVSHRQRPSTTTTTTTSTTTTTTSQSTGSTFKTLAPGSTLPSGADCAVRVRRSAWEPRPANYTANHTRGSSGAAIDGANSTFNSRYASRIDGNFVGTTDEILQWGACKWGFDEDITRARAIQESYWRQSQLGDSSSSSTTCAKIGKSAPCWQSYGILQVKGTVHEDTYPLSQTSTAYNVDYSLAWLRACFEGAFSHWMRNGYASGDQWGCVGAWYSGNWYDTGALGYIDGVKRHLANRVWTQSGF